MAGVDRAAPLRFLETAFEPDDWVAIFLKSYETSRVAQRVGSVSWAQSDRFQRWLLAMNSRKYSVFVSVNAISAGRRSRTRDAIGEVRHVFLDADEDGVAVLSRVESRRDLPPPSYILHTSPNHVHMFWPVTGFDRDLVERLQKQLARELGTDPAATPVTQNTRLPGFLYVKPPVVVRRQICRCCKNLTMRRCRVVREWKVDDAARSLLAPVDSRIGRASRAWSVKSRIGAA